MDRVAVLVVLLAITACTTLDAPVTDGRTERLLSADQWSCRARVAVRTDGGGGQGNLQWRQDGDISHISVSGPFRTGALEIESAPNGTTVRNSRGEIVSALVGDDAADLLIENALGWPFPAASARFWLLGLLDPALPGEVMRDEAGALAGLRQHNWNIAFVRFSEAGGEKLPSRIRLESSTTRIKVVIHRWDI